ncbi:DUF3313 family protein [Candidatus Sulfurimonas marisnigri]|uniref:DUF3313 family protein n=1 Tax=Candidatus Sulfurimonas marisnigri TaxID=2740405 RepID=A0A7S7LZZ3_9BACT|nr:DUF3313 family protein [Candidatus Sulfurimonas marisnigri]QOY54576.1 DUF3313 family protein [Candidatus Sulfurimonas marisnigri]
MRLQTSAISIIIGVVFFMSGCSSRTVQVKNSGFFEDYTKLDNAKSNKADLSKYKNIIVAPVLVISSISEDKQTISQKKLYKEISEYLTSAYKKEIENSKKFKLTEIKSVDTLKLESAVSAVEVHFDDNKWDDFTPIAMGVNVVSYNVYMDEDVRILGESRLVDSKNGEVLRSIRKIQEGEKIIIKNNSLEFNDIKQAIDSWFVQVREDLNRY